MEQIMRPVDVISVCSAEGEIRPLRLRLEGTDSKMIRMDILEILGVEEISHIGIESHVFLCRARAEGKEMLLELKYSFRDHCWCLLRRLC